MPLVRATLPTALSTVRQLIGDLKKTARDTGSSPALDNLVSSLDSLDAYGTRKGMDVEIMVLAPLDPEEATRTASWIGPGYHPGKLLTASADPTLVEVPGPPVDLRVFTRAGLGRVIQKAGTPRPPVLVVLATKPMTLSPDDKANLERAFEDRPHVTLVASAKKITVAAAPPPTADGTLAEDGSAPAEGGEAAPAPEPVAPSPADEPWFKEMEALAKAGAWTSVTHRTLPEGLTLQTRISSPPLDGFNELFKAHSSAVALESLAGVFDMIMDQQQNEIRMNKAVAQQKMAKFGVMKPGGPAPVSPIADLLADLKTRVQRLSQEFERGAADRLQDLLGQPAGMLVRDTEQLLASLEDLDFEEKTKTMGCKVPAAFEERVNKLIREKVGRHCAVDLVALNDLFRLIGQEFDRTLTQAQGPPIVVQFRYLTDERVRRMLDMYGIFQSVYKGEMPRPGFGEYFASVRKYSMILVMVASMFGLSALVRQYREFTVPLTILLVAFGTYQVAIGTKKTRIENTQTQLDNARTAMRADIRKIIAELQKQWGTILKQYLDEQISGAIGELDATLKQYQGRKGAAAEVDPEKERLQRQIVALEASEKRMVTSVKTKETLSQTITQVKGDLKGLMAGPAVPGMPGAKPGMPGVPGMPPRPAMPGAAGAKPGMPPKPGAAGGAPSPMAEAKAKLEAMKAAKAAPAAARPAAAAAPAAAAPAAPAAAAPAAAAPAAAPAAAGGGGGAAAAIQAKMAAMKAARAGAAAPAAPAPDAAAPAAPAEPAAPPAPAAPAAAEAAAPAAAPAAKPGGAAAAFQAKMAAMKAAKAGGAAAAPAQAAPAEGAPAAAAAPAEGAAPDAAAAPAAAPAAKAGGAAAAFQAKMAAMKAAKAGGAAAGAAAAGAAVAVAATAAEAPADPEPAPQEAAPAATEPAPEQAPGDPAAGGAAEGEHGFAETMAIPPAEKVDLSKG